MILNKRKTSKIIGAKIEYTLDQFPILITLQNLSSHRALQCGEYYIKMIMESTQDIMTEESKDQTCGRILIVLLDKVQAES